MSWRLRFRLREHLRTAMWPVPVGCAALGLIAGTIAWRLDRWGGWVLFEFKPAGATALTAAIVGAMITFVGIVFSVLLVAVQFASTQLTPRALKLSLSDPVSKMALGVFVGTLLYALVVMARITNEFVPQLALVGAGALVLASLFIFLLLVSHVGETLRPVHVVARVARRGQWILERTYPEPIETATSAAAALGPALRGGRRQTVPHGAAPGVVLGFDAAGLVAEARRCDARVALVPAVGDFVPSGAPLFHVLEGATPVDARRLSGSVALGPERTLEQDPTFAFRILVDVAIKALSPAVNDPTSAVMAIDRLHDLLLTVGRRRLDVGWHRDAEGHVRLTVDAPSWDDYVSLVVDEIRQYGAGSVQVARRLRAMLLDLRTNVPELRRGALEEELTLLAGSVERAFPEATDRGRASVPDQQGLGSSPAGAAARE